MMPVISLSFLSSLRLENWKADGAGGGGVGWFRGLGRRGGQMERLSLSRRGEDSKHVESWRAGPERPDRQPAGAGVENKPSSLFWSLNLRKPGASGSGA